MEYKLLEKHDVELMKYFVDDENTKYDEVILNKGIVLNSSNAVTINPKLSLKGDLSLNSKFVD